MAAKRNNAGAALHAALKACHSLKCHQNPDKTQAALSLSSNEKVGFPSHDIASLYFEKQISSNCQLHALNNTTERPLSGFSDDLIQIWLQEALAIPMQHSTAVMEDMRLPSKE